MQVDGLDGCRANGGGVSTYIADISNARKIVMTTSGGLGEAEVGGPTLSIVPKSGGNRWPGRRISRASEGDGREQLLQELQSQGSPCLAS